MGHGMKYRLGDLTVKSWNDWDRVPRMPEFFVQAFAGAIGAGTAATVLGYVTYTLVTSYLLRALAPTPDFGGQQRGLLTNTRQATAPQQIVYGEVRKGGIITFMESTGDSNEYLHQIICLAGHEVNDIGDIYINDEVVTLDNDGFVTDSRWLGSASSKKIRIKKHLGADNQTADSDLVSETSVTSDFKGQGIAYIYVRMEYDQNVFSDGIPLFTAKVQGKKVYQPNNSTTGYTANAASCIRDYLVSEYGLDNDGDVNDTMFALAADTCDDDITLAATGTEKRYEMNGVVSLDRSPSDILADMMTSCAGTLFWGQGQWQLKVGEYTSPVKTFTLDDFRSAITLDTRHSRRDNFNIVRGTFNDANQDYIRADYPELRSLAFISDDNGIESEIDLNLPFTTSSPMAQRLAKMTLFRAREQMTLSADFGLEAMEVQVGDIISLKNDRYGWDTAKEFEVVGWKFQNSGETGELKISMTLRETSSAAFDWDADESDITGNDTSVTDGITNLTITNLTASNGGTINGDGSYTESAFITWDTPSNAFITHYDIEWKTTAENAYASTTSIRNNVHIKPLKDGAQYLVRVRAVTSSGYAGPYASVLFTGGGDTVAPSKPTGITAVGHFQYVSLRWTNPLDADLNFIEIYANTTDSSGTATLVGVSTGDNFLHTNLDISETYYYFLKAVDYSGNKSAFTTDANWTDGVNSATTTFVDDGDFENNIRQMFIDRNLDMIEPVSTLPASGAYTGQQVFLLTDGKLYNWDGSSWTGTVADVGDVDFSDLTGQISAAQIVGRVVAANNIVSNSITSGELSTGLLLTNTAQIQDGLITNAKINNLAVTTAKIGDNAVTFPQSAISTTITDLDTSDPETTIQTLTVSRSGAPAQIVGTAHVSTLGSTTSGYAVFDFSLYRGSTLVSGFNNSKVQGANSFDSSCYVQDVQTGTQTYYLKAQCTSLVGTISNVRLISPVIQFIELKK